ncbi:PucR family transcriptional regulator [Streptacidiphilus fuscans]|uniref:Helix-turn-helix domain-containing protein n=1 Tax=Streptacidiphilus fuscans TaxID=2789292 RepID=A0A931BA03_9ACTN|nr:helix-turn-helix domain-containing protein [Streptacidiphilus fuscans]MBF9071382.1 helix-turn-helix domain-containing protein [Streptacidiphilus fuscans]
MKMANLPTHSGTSEELYALADAIGAVTGGAVAIEDLDHRVLAYSTLPDQRIDEHRRQGILERRVPNHQPEQLAQYREVMVAPGVVRLPVLAEAELPRAAVAIRAGHRPLGTIWAIEGDKPIDAEGERAMVDGARLAALHMLRRRSAAELDLQAREDALRAALRGRRTAREVRFELGLPGQRPLALLGFAPVAPESGGGDAAGDDLLVRLAAASTRHWPAVHAEASVATVGRTVYVLLPLDEAVSAFATARRLGEQAAAVLDLSVETPLRAAASRIGYGPEELPDLRAEVDDVLRVTTADPNAPGFATLQDTHARVLLAHVADELARRPRLRHPGIDAMLEHDRTKGTSFADSVTAWLDALGNVGEAAAKLTIHPNTLKYRLRRANELFAIDLDHPDDRLSCWLQLRMPR